MMNLFFVEKNSYLVFEAFDGNMTVDAVSKIKSRLVKKSTQGTETLYRRPIQILMATATHRARC